MTDESGPRHVAFPVRGECVPNPGASPQRRSRVDPTERRVRPREPRSRTPTTRADKKGCPTAEIPRAWRCSLEECTYSLVPSNQDRGEADRRGGPCRWAGPAEVASPLLGSTALWGAQSNCPEGSATRRSHLLVLGRYRPRRACRSRAVSATPRRSRRGGPPCWIASSRIGSMPLGRLAARRSRAPAARDLGRSRLLALGMRTVRELLARAGRPCHNPRRILNP